MYGLVIVLHVIICGALVISVLLQSAKGEGLAGAFGGTSLTGTVFGGRGAATFLSKATTVLAVTFMASCIILSFLHPSARTRSVLEGGSAVEEAVHEAQPTAPPVTEPGTQQGGTAEPGGQPPTGPEGDIFDQPAPGTDQGTPPTDQPSGEADPDHEHTPVTPQEPDESNP